MIRLFTIVGAMLLLITGGHASAQPAAAPLDAAKACAAVRATDFGSLQDAPTSIISAAIITYGPDKREVCQI